MEWTPREDAERSHSRVQPIACTVLVSRSNRLHHVFRRVGAGRPDMRHRLSLVVGGHVERADGRPGGGLLATVSRALRRELLEELGVEPQPDPDLLGIVIDPAGREETTRHLGLLHETLVDAPTRPRNNQEFYTTSATTGRLHSAGRLRLMEDLLDPWSRVIAREVYLGGE